MYLVPDSSVTLVRTLGAAGKAATPTDSSSLASLDPSSFTATLLRL